MSFADLFSLTRGREGAYRGSDGAPAVAAEDVARFDHTVEGVALGLLVEGRPQFRDADEVEVVDGDWAVPGGTVVHEYMSPAGEIVRRAWYARTDPKSVMDACLNLKGWHRVLTYLPGYLPNRDGYVRFRNQRWDLGSLILADPDHRVVIGATETEPLLEG